MIGRMGASALYSLLMLFYNIGTGKHPKFVKFTKWICYAILFIMVLGLHRYGASDYWRLWANIAIPIMSIPIITLCLSMMTVWVARTNRFRMIGIFISCLLFWLLTFWMFGDVYIDKQFPDPGYFYGFIRSDLQFWKTFLISFALFFVMPFCVFYYFVKPEPEE